MNANSSSDQVAMQVTSGPAAEFISTSSKDAPIATYMNDLFRKLLVEEPAMCTSTTKNQIVSSASG